MQNPALVIMAAGIGSRYGGLKQLDPVGPAGEIIIDYSVYDAIRAGFKKVVFVIRREIEDSFREKVGRQTEKRVETAYVFQSTEKIPSGFTVPPNRKKPWGTAQAVLLCSEEVETPFAVINSDDFYGAYSFSVLADYLRTAEDRNGIGDYCMVGFILKNTLSDFGDVSRGFCRVNEDGYLEEIHEQLKIKKFGDRVAYTEDGEHWTDEDPESIVSTNMWGFTPSIFRELKEGFSTFLRANLKNPKAEYLLPEEIGRVVREQRATAKVLYSSERWVGVTYSEDKPYLQKAIRELIDRGVYPEKLSLIRT
ncbi:MAG: sugar phosphate nucleotidyltransferase [Candidatus Euphemobacter frigidus]|nr:sugar phosphate nucleotidyltransferase [Candidatus Euphemobacter frigidus]MDP8276091.1 sugar phosphate nucleotidyltransferase [Candidatus Euphemobacter frigidus]